jgi:hypothetical protein
MIDGHNSHDGSMFALRVLHTHDSNTMNPQFYFTNSQYERFEIATIVCSSISIVAAFLVISMYIYLHIHSPGDAGRVSLHCVIASTIFSLLDQITNLAALRSDVKSQYCTAFRILNSIFSLESSCLLGLVGIHLMLVFCFHVRNWPCRPEYILFPISVLYTIAGNMLGFIENDVPVGFRTIFLQTTDECW